MQDDHAGEDMEFIIEAKTKAAGRRDDSVGVGKCCFCVKLSFVIAFRITICGTLCFALVSSLSRGLRQTFSR